MGVGRGCWCGRWDGPPLRRGRKAECSDRTDLRVGRRRTRWGRCCGKRVARANEITIFRAECGILLRTVRPELAEMSVISKLAG